MSVHLKQFGENVIFKFLSQDKRLIFLVKIPLYIPISVSNIFFVSVSVGNILLNRNILIHINISLNVFW